MSSVKLSGPVSADTGDPVGSDGLRQRYRLAEASLPFNVADAASHARPVTRWLDGDDCLLLRADSLGWTILQVAADGDAEVVLRAADAAVRLEAARGAAVTASELHPARVRMSDEAVHVLHGQDCWIVPYQADGEVRRCGEPMDGVVSPDETRKAYVRDHNLWLWDYDEQRAVQLTSDGDEANSYGLHPDSGRIAILHRLLGRHPSPAVVWSADSKWLASHLLSQAQVPTASLIESTPADGGRPVTHTYAYSVPNDGEVPTLRVVLLEAGGALRSVRDSLVEPIQFRAPSADGNAWWVGDGYYFLVRSRDFHEVALHRLDAPTGRHDIVHSERADRWVSTGPYPTEPPLVRVLDGSSEFLWFSCLDTEGSLYLHDLKTGERKWMLGGPGPLPTAIVSVDEARRSLVVAVANTTPDPYKRALVRIALDDGASEALSDDDLDHWASVSPSGERMVDIASDTTRSPRTRLLDRAGGVVAAVADSEAGVIYQPPWSEPPERLRVVAADGVTELFATLYKPPAFDPLQQYPLVDYIYPGPQVGNDTPTHWSVEPKNEYAMAALGLLVLTIDGRGSPGRGQSFHTLQYQKTQTAGFLEDHVAALQQLCERYSFIDGARLACTGHSGGAYASFRAMALYPEVFKVGVCSSGDHDQRFYNSQWLERWHGADPSTYDGISNTDLADRLVGDLLLVHGELDDNVFPTQTLRLVDALIEHDKVFDLLVIPGVDHSLAGREGYFLKRSWDFLVEHLLGETPPRDFKVSEPPLEHYWRRLR
jgi:dipeptidyl-peptidase 4